MARWQDAPDLPAVIQTWNNKGKWCNFCKYDKQKCPLEIDVNLYYNEDKKTVYLLF